MIPDKENQLVVADTDGYSSIMVSVEEDKEDTKGKTKRRKK